jgi:hypothetical protein
MKMRGAIKTKVIGYPVAMFIIILFCAALLINTFIIQTEASVIGVLLIFSGVSLHLYFRGRLGKDESYVSPGSRVKATFPYPVNFNNLEYCYFYSK